MDKFQKLKEEKKDSVEIPPCKRDFAAKDELACAKPREDKIDPKFVWGGGGFHALQIHAPGDDAIARLEGVGVLQGKEIQYISQRF